MFILGEYYDVFFQSYRGNAKAMHDTVMRVLFPLKWSVDAVQHILQRMDAFKGDRQITVPRAKDAGLWATLELMLNAGYISEDIVLAKLFDCALAHAMTPLAMDLKNQDVTIPSDNVAMRFMEGITAPDVKILETIAVVNLAGTISRDKVDMLLSMALTDVPKHWCPTLRMNKIKAVLALNPSVDGIMNAMRIALTEIHSWAVAELLANHLPADFVNEHFEFSIAERSLDSLAGWLSIKNGPKQDRIDFALKFAADTKQKDIIATLLGHRHIPSQGAIDKTFIAMAKNSSNWAIGKPFNTAAKKSNWPIVKVFLAAKAKPSVSALTHVLSRSKPGSRRYLTILSVLEDVTSTKSGKRE
jgi:hypothetical protein